MPTSTETVELGSVAQPQGDAEVRPGTSTPPGAPGSTPVLTVRQVDVPSFSLVGVTWAASAAVTDTVARVRVQRADGGWGSWAEVGVEDAEQDGAARRGGTAPLWTGPSTGVEVELVTRSGAAPVDVQLDLVDPGESDADTGLSSPAIQDTAHAATDMPDVFSRAQWGADESLRTWAPEYASTIRAATVHHTADSNGYSAADVPAMMRSIYRYHAVSRGWGDIGYNVVVDRFGRLWEGRSGGLASTVVGAHAGGFNTGTFGVSMLGDYDAAPAPQVMVDAVAAIIAWKFSLYGVDPTGTVTLTSGGGGTSRYAAGARVTLPTIFGHRDVGNTSCPGRYGYARLGEIRAAVAAKLTSREYEMQAAAVRAGGAAVLGAQRGGLVTDGLVSWQGYDNGRVYWAAGSGAHALTGSWLQSFVDAGGAPALGAPRTDVRTSVRSGQVLLLERGAITRTVTAPMRVLTGETYARWIALGAENGWLGYPTSGEAVVPGGGFTAFEGGSVYRSAATGAHAVRGGIYEAWARLGYETGVLGFPTADEVPVAGGFVSTFQGGSIFWSP
ncbi:N-acetylmuramoyl-L-alanine amidase, partial [Klenkia sp. LSe6-5]